MIEMRRWIGGQECWCKGGGGEGGRSAGVKEEVERGAGVLV